MLIQVEKYLDDPLISPSPHSKYHPRNPWPTGARTGERLGTCHGFASDVRMGSFSPDTSMVLVVSQAQIREKKWRFQGLGTLH